MPSTGQPSQTVGTQTPQSWSSNVPGKAPAKLDDPPRKRCDDESCTMLVVSVVTLCCSGEPLLMAGRKSG